MHKIFADTDVNSNISNCQTTIWLYQGSHVLNRVYVLAYYLPSLTMITLG